MYGFFASVLGDRAFTPCTFQEFDQKKHFQQAAFSTSQELDQKLHNSCGWIMISSVMDKTLEKHNSLHYNGNTGGGLMVKRSNYLNAIIPFIDTELIKVLTGVRRSGKSVMLKLIQNHLI